MAKSISKKIRRKGRFIQKHEEWMESPAYRDLNPVARCLLEEFQRVYLPGRNGRLVLSVRQASERIRANKDTIARAFHTLAEHGYIALEKGEYWQESKAREWRLTIEPTNGREPTDEWRLWQPGAPVASLPKKKSRSQKEGRTCTISRDKPTQCEGQQWNTGESSVNNVLQINELRKR
ncbi:hypothetical protein [Halioglobus sp. Uisw_031]|uniref:hypothetical protein n=1 Tax=Halioglobus sp. Uisw_031 TaxID=3230977 RepID=UPI0039E7F414